MIKKQRVILVDDEYLARDELKDTLRRKHRDVEVVGEAGTPDEAWALIEQGGIDGVFLDINLETGSRREGMDLAHSISNLATPPWIVFTSAYREFAVEAFSVHAAHYLVKPFSDDDVAEALDRVRKDYAPKPLDMPGTLAIRHKVTDELGESQSVVEFVDPKAEILYVCTIPDNDKLRVHLLGCRDLLGVSGPLKDWQDRLLPYGFEIIHKSYLVNRDFRDRLQPHPVYEETRQLKLKKGCLDLLPVSRSYQW